LSDGLMAELPRIELVPRLESERLGGDRPDYSIYTGQRMVGRIYLQNVGQFTEDSEQWFWGVQGVFTSMEIGHLRGLAGSLDEAKARLRAAFDLWLAWALAAPATHLSYHTISKDLRDVGAAPANAPSPDSH
jgi:hypothetical protein